MAMVGELLWLESNGSLHMAVIHSRLHAAYTQLLAAVVRPALLVPEPFTLGSKLGVSEQQVLEVVKPFARQAYKYFKEETQDWWQPPLAFAQFADPDPAVRKAAAAYWAGEANSLN